MSGCGVRTYLCTWPSGQFHKFTSVQAFDGYVRALRDLGLLVVFSGPQNCSVQPSL